MSDLCEYNDVGVCVRCNCGEPGMCDTIDSLTKRAERAEAALRIATEMVDDKGIPTRVIHVEIKRLAREALEDTPT